MTDTDDLRLATMTHARLRAEQGDVGGARALLRRVLEQAPAHLPALELLERLEGRCDAPRIGGGADREEPRQPGDPARLALAFRARLGKPGTEPRSRRIARLEDWLERITGAPALRRA